MPKLFILFVRSESVLFGHTQIDKVRPALNSFVRVHCFRLTDSCCNRLPVVACDISKGSSHPSTIIDDSNNFAPVLRIGQNAPFSVTATSRKTAI